MRRAEKSCTIYYTSDIHGYLFPTDYVSAGSVPLGLLACIPLFEKDGNTLILDGGDTIQGSPFAYYLRNNTENRFPIARVMNEIGYDFVTLGNHDFNFGYEGLQDFLGDLEARCLCANVIDTKGKLPIAPSAVKTLENGLTVGLVGLVTNYVRVWETEENLEGVGITDCFEAARRAVQALSGKVDLLIGIYHGGYECAPENGTLLSETDENIACRLCRELDFDLLLTGHQHQRHDGSTMCGTFTVQPRANAAEVCRISVAVDAQSHVSVQSRWLVPAAHIPGRAARCASLLQPLEDSVQHYLDSPAGTLNEPLRFESWLHMALHGSSVAMLINQVQLESCGAQLSCTCLYNSNKEFGRVITVRDVLTIYQFANTLKVLHVTGATLRLALERCASYFDVDRNGNPIVSERFSRNERQHYDYDYFSGITYGFDISKSIGERVVKLTYEGEDVRDEDEFSLCMNSYRSTGGGGYDWYRSCRVISDPQLEIPQLLIEYFERHIPIPPIPSTPFTVQGFASV